MKIIITEGKVEILKELIKTRGIKEAISVIGGLSNLVKVLGYDTVPEYIYQYLTENLYPDYGWESPDYYKEEIKRFGEILFNVNDSPSYEYKLHYDGGTHLDIYQKMFNQMEEIFSIDGDNSVWLKVFGKWFKKNTGLKVDRII